MKPLTLYCANCDHFNGDAHCSLPVDQQLIRGAIVEPESVVCEKHEPKEATDDDRQLAGLDAHQAERVAEGIAYENALYRAGGQY